LSPLRGYGGELKVVVEPPRKWDEESRKLCGEHIAVAAPRLRAVDGYNMQ